MRNTMFCLITLLILIVSGIAQARDTRHLFLIDDAMSASAVQDQLNSGVKFYFGTQKHASVKADYGEDFTNKKTNAFNKNDKTACEWVFLSAMLQLQERAQQLGADAVVNIHSFYKKIPFVSDTEYECHAGGIIAGVALKGTFVKLVGGAESSNNVSVKPVSTTTYESPVKEVQRKLTAQGYDPGPVDGYMGTKTSEAIKEFQADKGLPITGKLDNGTMSAIGVSESDASKDMLAGKGSSKVSGEVSNGEGKKTTQIKCTVDQILELQKIGLTPEQISSACEA